MRIKKIQIKRFRGIEDSISEIKGYNVLIGRNGVGKSSFLKALDFFYAPSFGIGVNDFFHQVIAQPIEVAITYNSLSKEALEEFKSYIQDGLLTVTKKAIWNGVSAVESYHGSKMACPDFDKIRSLDGTEKKEEYNKIVSSGNYTGLEKAKTIPEVEQRLEDWEKLNINRCQLKLDEGKFFGFKNVGTGKIDKYSNLVLIPAVRDASEDALDTGKSSLKKLLDIALSRALNTAGLMKEFTDDTVSRYQKIIEKEAFCLDTVNSRLNDALKRYAPRAELNLEWMPLKNPSIAEPAAIAKLVEDGFTGEIAFKGHGLQRAYIMSILHFLAEVQKGVVTFGKETAEHSIPGLILAIEEPELYQHPSQARFLAKTLVDMTEIDNGKSPLQVICTSHSPYFVDVRTYEYVQVVRKIPSQSDGTKLSTVMNSSTFSKVAEKLKNAHKSTTPFDEHGLKARLVTLLNPHINEVFFAEFVIIVEGEEDRAILSAVMPLHKDASCLEAKGVSIIPVNGKNNIDKLRAILDTLSIPSYVIFDKDGQDGKNEVPNQKTNIALQRLLGVSEPGGSPGQIITEDYAIFDPDFQKAIDNAIGGSKWIDCRNKIAEELGYAKHKYANKNPAVLRMVFEKLEKEGTSLPSCLTQCLDSIVKKHKAIYN